MSLKDTSKKNKFFRARTHTIHGLDYLFKDSLNFLNGVTVNLHLFILAWKYNCVTLFTYFNLTLFYVILRLRR